MSLYRFEINGTEINEPLGWKKAKRRLARNKTYKALFLEYIIDLTFDTDGYDLIKSLILSGGYCGDITFQVFKRQNQLADSLLHFDGKLILANIRENETLCQITCDVEDNSLSSILINNGDFKARFDVTASVGGSAISLTKRTIAIYDQFNTAWSNRYGYYVFDVFQFLLNYMSNNQITFVSNLLSTFTNQYPTYVSTLINATYRFRQVITFTNPLNDLQSATNPSVDFQYRYMGHTYQVTVATTATVAATLNTMMFAVFHNGDASADSTMQKFYKQRMLGAGEVVTNGTTNIEIYSDFKFIIDYVKDSGGTSVATITNADIPESTGIYGYGGVNNLYKLSILNVNQLRNANTRIPSISFNELFSELDKCTNLGISLTNISGVPTLRLEQLSYFYQDTEQISIQNIPELKYIINKAEIYNAIKTSEGSDSEQVSDVVLTDYSVELDLISSIQCIGSKKDLNNTFLIDWSEIDQYIIDTDDKRDYKILFLECVNTVQVGCDAESKLYRYRIYTDIAGTNVVAFVKNILLSNYSKVRNWLINIIGNPGYGQDSTNAAQVFNNYTDALIKEYIFEYPLTDDQFESIRENMFNYITFNKGTEPGTAHTGWIIDITREEVSGKTTLKLLSR